MAESGRKKNENDGRGRESQEKPDLSQLSCDMCDKEFQDPTQLLTHLRNHVAEEKNPSIRAIANTILKSIAAKLAPEGLDTGRGPESRAARLPLTTAAVRVKVETRDDAQEQDQPTKCDSSEDIIKNRDPNKPKKQYRSKIFQKKLKNQAGLHRHERADPAVKSYQCVYCKKFFSLEHNMRRHVRRLHTTGENRETPYQCVYCKKYLCSKNSMRMHVRQHTGERPYECPFCEKAYTAPAGLKWHLQIKAHGQVPSNRASIS